MFDWWKRFWNKPLFLTQDVTDSELPYEARSTWDNLDDAYDD